MTSCDFLSQRDGPAAVATWQVGKLQGHLEGEMHARTEENAARHKQVCRSREPAACARTVDDNDKSLVCLDPPRHETT